MKKGNRFYKWIICLLVVTMTFCTMPLTAFGSEYVSSDNSKYDQNTTSVIQSNNGNDEIVINSYLINHDNEEINIKACDIVFVLDQSRWMNTVDDSGAQRAAIISAMNNLINHLATPTNGQEHRIAIAGYGRINVGGGADQYDASTFPGQVNKASNTSVGTGYYTTNGFVSKNGWTEVKDVNSSELPQLPANYLTNESYENVFMSLDEAQEVLNPDTMMAWYAGASRMDAGLTIAEQLADIAKAHDTDSDRNLVVCIMSSSLPIRNDSSVNKSVIRSDAAIAAAEELKSEGATIFAFGDYHPSGASFSGMQDTEANFNMVMKQICTESDYFYSLSGYENITDVMNEMITDITIISTGESVVASTVTATEFIKNSDSGDTVYTWQQLKEIFGDKTEELINSSYAEVKYYNFIGYDENGVPQFDKKSSLSKDVALSTMVNEDGISYNTNLVPIPSYVESNSNLDDDSHYGYMVKITIARPVVIEYEWASDEPSYAPPKISIPEDSIVPMGTYFPLPVIRSDDEHYGFSGWYYDKECTSKCTSTIKPTSDLTLYGKWEKYNLIEFNWDVWETNYDYPDAVNRIVNGGTPNLYTPTDVEGYTFGGWYTDKDLEEPYVDGPVDKDIELYAKWIANTDTKYTVEFYQQNVDDDEYTLISDDTLELEGTTGDNIQDVNKEYSGFTLANTTYQDSSESPQTAPLTIAGDGSLVVKMYYNRDTYEVSYDGNGQTSGDAPVTETYKYQQQATTASNTFAKDGYVFAGWNTEANGSGSEYNPDDTFTVTENTVLYAQWLPNSTIINPTKAIYRVEYYQQNLDGNYYLISSEFPLYGDVDSEVTADTPEYKHYTLNEELSNITGIVTMPTEVDGAVHILTLRVFYDLDEYTVSYDLDGGTALDDVSYETSSYKYGQEVTIKPAPTKEGYEFLYWQLGNEQYKPGETIEPSENIILVAKYKKIQSDETPDSSGTIGDNSDNSSNTDNNENTNVNEENVNSSVSTGDLLGSSLLIYGTLLGLSIISIAGILLFTRQKKK